MLFLKGPMLPSANIRNLSSLLARSLFLGNIPDTAFLIIYRAKWLATTHVHKTHQLTSSGFLAFISRYEISFNPPGNIVW